MLMLMSYEHLSERVLRYMYSTGVHFWTLAAWGLFAKMDVHWHPDVKTVCTDAPTDGVHRHNNQVVTQTRGGK